VNKEYNTVKNRKTHHENLEKPLITKGIWL